MKNILKESHQYKLQVKILKTKLSQNPASIVTKARKKSRIDKKNHEWIEDYIAIRKKSRLGKSQDRDPKSQ